MAYPQCYGNSYLMLRPTIYDSDSPNLTMNILENSKGSRLQNLGMKFWETYPFPLIIIVDQNTFNKYNSFHLNIIDI